MGYIQKYYLLFFLFFFNCVLSIDATNYYVNDNALTNDVFCSSVGNNSNNGTSPSTPKATLTDVWNTYGTSGTNAISVGDTIFVDAGTYYRTDRNLSLSNGVTIYGAGMTKTKFDNGQAGSSGYYFAKIYSDVNLCYFTITQYGIDNTYAQALDIQPNATGVIVKKIQVNDCGRTTGYYPIEVGSGASVLFDGGGSTCNSSWVNSGGIEISGTTTNVIIKNYSFIGNEREEYGAVLKINDGTVNIYNTLFQDNTVSAAVSIIYQLAGALNIYDCVFKNNNYSYTYNDYGGLLLIKGGNFYMTRSRVENTNKSNSSYAYGAGLCIYGNVSAEIDSCFFSNNIGSRGNDVHVKGSSASLYAFNCTFGSASSQLGTTSSGTITIENSGNPGVYTNGGSTTKINTTSPSYTPNPTTNTFTGSCATSVVLPVELSLFNADCTSGGVSLFWTTASELNNDYFMVEKSYDGSNFSTIAIVDGNGTTNSKSEYNYVDINLSNKISGVYYRLTQVDFNGTDKQSKVLYVSLPCDKQDIGLKNLTIVNHENNFQLLFYSAIPDVLNFQITNIKGQIIFSNKLSVQRGYNSIVQNIPLLKREIYFVTLFSNNYQVSKKVYCNK